MNRLQTRLLLGATLLITTFSATAVSARPAPTQKPVTSAQADQPDTRLAQQTSIEQILNQAFDLLDAGKPADALAAFDRAIALDESAAVAWMGRGFALDDLERYPEAIASFRQALTLDRQIAPAWVGLGIALDDNGDPNAALDAYQQAIALNPNSFFA